jgi:DNA transposition AAA+ family ATPase
MSVSLSRLTVSVATLLTLSTPCFSIAGVIRMTGGNFRLLSRLLTQVERILEVNGLTEVTLAVVQAARESLVIGQA